MNNTAKKPKDVSWAKITATLDRATALSEKNEKGMAELKKSIAATGRELDRMAKEREIAAKEREISMKELKEAIFGVNSEVKGIAKSNGMMAEDYFYASLNKSKTLGGVHFDRVLRNVANGIKLENGKEINEEYDTVMYNKTSLCIIEVKYKVERQDVRKLAKKRVQHFKMLFPMYAKYKIYLAVGGMTFEKGAVDTAKELGMGVLQLDGDAVVVYDKDLKVY